MQTTKATIKFLDGFGRMVLLSDKDGAILLHGAAINGYHQGDEVTLYREDNQKRMTDWKIEAGDHENGR